MAIDVNVQNVTSGYNLAAINSNFQNIKTALQDALSRIGDVPNELHVHLDMNGFDILNVGSLSVDDLVYGGDEVPVINIKYEGLWNSSDTYGYNYLVKYNGDIYRALQTTVNNQPNTSPAYWELFLEAGQDGTNGQDGADGALSGVEEIKTGAYTITASDSGKIIVGNSSSPITFSFDAVATLGNEFVVIIKNIGTGLVTLDPDGSETIDGSTTYTVPQNTSLMVNSNGSVLKTFFRDAEYTLPTATDSTLGGVELATANEIRAGTAGALAVTAEASLSSAAYVAATYASTITLDHSVGFHRSTTLTGNPTIANPTNVRVGYPLVYHITQDGTGNRVPTWGSNFKLGEATLTLSTTANAQDLVIFHALSATQFVFLGIVKGIQ